MKFFVLLVFLLFLFSCSSEKEAISAEELDNLSFTFCTDGYPDKKYFEHPDPTPKKFLSSGMVLGELSLTVTWKQGIWERNSKSISVQGIVSDQEGMEKLPNAEVYIGKILENARSGNLVIEITDRATTDDEGYFMITSKLDKESCLCVSYLGFTTKVYYIFELLNR